MAVWRAFARRGASSAAFPSSESARGFLHEQSSVVNALRKEQIIRGVPVAGINEDGHGVVGIHVRKDKQSFEFSFARALPGEKLNLLVESAQHDKYKKKEPGKYRLLVDERGAASLDEVQPRCAHFSEKCGGCALQHLDYEAQMREKHALLRLRLEQYGLAKDHVKIHPAVASPQPFGWHARTEFRFFLRGGLQLGLHPVGDPVPVAISHCHLHSEASHRAFQAVLGAARQEPQAVAFDERTGRGWLCSAVFRAAPPPFSQVLVTLVTLSEVPKEVLCRMADKIMADCEDVVGVTWSLEGGEPAQRTAGWRSAGGEQQELLAGEGHLAHAILGVPLEAVPEAFARPNMLLAESVTEAVVRLSGANSHDIIWDCFCGQGLLSLPLLVARGCRRLVGLDRSEPALAALRRGLKRCQGLEAEVVTGDLGSPAFLRMLASRLEGSDEAAISSGSLPESLPRPTVLLADPGRNGLPKAFRRLLFDLEVPTLVYIGVGKALLRDLTLLCRRGYELQELVPFDSWPHSARLEVVARLVWKGLKDDGELWPSAKDDELDWQ